MRMVEVNINNTCEVVLRAPGEKLIREHFAEYDLAVPEMFLVGVGGTIREQIWVLMGIFGEGFLAGGMDPPIETTIKIEVKGG